MKRFLVFSGDNYYPQGGFDDFRSDHDTIEEAKQAAESANGDWAQVADTQTGEYSTYTYDYRIKEKRWRE